MSPREFGPVWIAVVKFISAAAVPTVFALIAWGRGVESRVNAHDIVVSVLRQDRDNVKETLDGMRSELSQVNKQLAEMQASIAVLTANKK